ncbi:hypothetical protein NP493_1859g00033 [Ridgeia piscesae]|uniref:Uncharacterized protein n=1 Tax=Ridgeia piscesae TaxID=27915 RepID=A0AAD9N853_RIDPI|nr:hypothetical protein NP493_1859g00033 [Ridgeia piscesae]
MEQLRVIQLERCGLTPESLTALMAGVTGGCHQLEKFVLAGDTCLGTVGVAESVGVFLRGTSHLRELKLGWCGLTPHSLTTLMTHMTGGCLQLEEFNLNNDHSPCLDTETAAQSLCDCLRQWTRLRRLHLEQCRLTSQTFDVVSTGIRQCHELQEFM